MVVIKKSFLVSLQNVNKNKIFKNKSLGKKN